ncbi:MAG: hypothetical protein HKO98_06010 [Gemmatimonadetes bacterium]|nr:hypothetical protein [Gemmatimonadota bacterium]
MNGRLWGGLLLGLTLAACEDDLFIVPPGGGGSGPAAPRSVAASYYAGAVTVTWELGPGWDGESFRVYGKRASDPDYFLIAEVTNCAGGFCSYSDINILEAETYDYYVAAVDPSGFETASATAVRVDVPFMTPPPVPGQPVVVALDDANYVTWDAAARSADDFAFYRVYLVDQGAGFLLGETDSEGFLDLLAPNGATQAYFVSAVDDSGHESGGSAAAEGTPRPDFHGEVVYDYFARPDLAGFAFQADEFTDPIVDGDSPARHFRMEVDADGWWLVPGPGVTVYGSGFETTALKCGPGADAGCTALEVAPTSGYQAVDLALFTQTTYVLRIPGNGGDRFAVIRVELLGFDQAGDPLMIFDWAYQLQVGNPNLAPRGAIGTRAR